MNASEVSESPPVSMNGRNGGTERVAAIDIGTNSFHMVVAEVDAHGGFTVVSSDKEPVRLGAGMGDGGELNLEAMERGVACLDRFRQVADAYGASLRAVATSAVREAPNGADFIAEARKRASVNIDVISGTEEARLIHLGVLQALPIFAERSVVVDIGGGSTELIVGHEGEMLAARSMRIGHLRLTSRFFPDGVVEPGSVDACRAYTRAFLVPATRAVRSVGFEIAAGSSGTITTVASLLKTQDSSLDGRTITREGLDRLTCQLVAFRTPTQRVAAIQGLETTRADVIVGGAILLQEVFTQLGVDQMTASPYALREGVLLDRIHPDLEVDDAGISHLNNIRRTSVLRFVDAFEEDRSHVQHATELALQLFDALAGNHDLGIFERDLLEAAGLLHNVGLFVSHAAHHKHSYYLIRNSDRLNGFTNNEVELIAQVARYHRRSAPKGSHYSFMALTERDQYRVRTLAGILRVAIALDRTRSRAVADVSTCMEADPPAGVDGPLRIRVGVLAGADASLELYTARNRSALLAHTLNREVTIEAVTIPSR